MLLHWAPLAKTALFHAVNNHPVVEDCCKLLKVWQSLQLLNEHSELFWWCQYFSDCVTKQLGTCIWFFYIKRHFSFDFIFFSCYWILWEFQIQRRAMHSWLLDLFSSSAQMAQWDFQPDPFHFLFVCLFLVTWTLSENFKFRCCFPHWQMPTLAWFYVKRHFFQSGLGWCTCLGTFNIFFLI